MFNLLLVLLLILINKVKMSRLELAIESFIVKNKNEFINQIFEEFNKISLGLGDDLSQIFYNQINKCRDNKCYIIHNENKEQYIDCAHNKILSALCILMEQFNYKCNYYSDFVKEVNFINKPLIE